MAPFETRHFLKAEMQKCDSLPHSDRVLVLRSTGVAPHPPEQQAAAVKTFFMTKIRNRTYYQGGRNPKRGFQPLGHENHSPANPS